MTKIRKWFNWKRFWTVHGYIQMIVLLIASLLLNDFYLAYVSGVVAMAFFGLAECKKEGK